MSRTLEPISQALVEATQALLTAMEESAADEEIASLVASQLEAFNAFSLACDPRLKRSPRVEQDIDALLELDRRIVALAERQGAHLLVQQRKATQRQSAARAFRTPEESQPRFFTQRI